MGKPWSKEQREKFERTIAQRARKRKAHGRKAAGSGKGQLARIPVLDGPPVLTPESDMEVSVHAGSAITFAVRGVRITVRAIA